MPLNPKSLQGLYVRLLCPLARSTLHFRINFYPDNEAAYAGKIAYTRHTYESTDTTDNICPPLFSFVQRLQ